VAHEHPWNGGVLSTAGGLVFQGDAMGFFSAYRASDGERLWQAPANNGIVAAPISYEVDGDQYVAVLAGWGGSLALHGGAANDPAVGGATGRLLVYRLGAAGQPPPGPAPLPAIPEPPELTADDEQLQLGFEQYARHCTVCHGFRAIGGGLIPDLRYLSPETHAIFDQIVGEGLLEPAGMPSFEGRLSDEEIEAIHAYVIFEAQREWERQNDWAWWRSVKETAADAAAWLLLKLQ
jgi:quinohemoprotein ethanol dehydrogenase